MNNDRLKFSFCIITDGKDYVRNLNIVKSIHNLGIPKEDFEVIICGGVSWDQFGIKWIPFDEDGKIKGHITKKKNLCFKKASFDNISITHDYMAYHPDWYKNFVEFDKKNPDWDCIVCRVENFDKSRFRDWNQFRTDFPLEKGLWARNAIQWLDYKDHSTTHLQYISGGAYCIKKKFALKYPLNEELGWAQSEDLDFCLRVRNFWKLKCNPKSIYQCLKQKDQWPPKSDEFGWKHEYETYKG